MNEHDSRSTNESPLQLLATMVGALTDAMNLRHFRSELYGNGAPVDLTPEPRLTVVGPSWSVPPSLTQQNLSDQQFALQATPFDRARRRRM
jgi:hypothetical protein